MKRQSSNHHFQANSITFICPGRRIRRAGSVSNRSWWDKLESNCLPDTRIRQLYDGLPTDPSSLRHYYYAAATFIGCSNIHDCISTIVSLSPFSWRGITEQGNISKGKMIDVYSKTQKFENDCYFMREVRVL